MQQDKTALVTGASAGIGQAFARQLAPRCRHMILVGRRLERLQSLGEELAREYGVSTTPLAVDLATDAGLKRVVAAVEDAGPLDYVVNNAGFTIIGRTDELSLESQLDMVQVHVKAVMSITRAALPAMRARKSGAIVNVSSMCAFTPYRDVAVYGGTKAFVDNYSRGLAMELADEGVQVQSLVPGFTHSELHDREAFDNYETPEVPEHLWMSAEDVVKECLAGLDAQRVLQVAGRVNRDAASAALRQTVELLDH